MGIRCGSQVTVCRYPVSFDTYSGCSHGCKYCFARAIGDINNIKPLNCIKQLRRFVGGWRTNDTKWCDWNIPVHFGGTSDPFQPAEVFHGLSYAALEVFAETGYPVIISTKGRAIIRPEYLSLLKKCNAVVQVSAVCSAYDEIEPGAPGFAERLKMVEALSDNCKRVIIRAQPYFPEALDDLVSNMKQFKAAGAYGITVEGIKFKKKKPGTVKVDGDFCIPERVLGVHYNTIKEAAHSYGMAFFCAENRLRKYGDSLACCGCGDMEGFTGNLYNSLELRMGFNAMPTDRMKEAGTAGCFSAIAQNTLSARILRAESFAAMIKKSAEKKVSVLHTEEESLRFTIWLKSTGIKPQEINKLTGTLMASHYLCTKREGQYAVPTPEQFDKLRKSHHIKTIPSDIIRIVYGDRKTVKQ